MTLTFEEAAGATSARVENADGKPAFVDVSIDTRSIRPGQTYVALRGENFDGHNFIEDALKGGAAAIVAEHIPQEVRVPALLVADTKRAYMDLASQARSKFSGAVVAITGSTGKTTTKEFLAQLLSTKFGDHVVAAPANENNEIGVSKLLLGVDSSVEALVVEMGARHFGDIAELVEIARPNVSVLTNIGEAHLEIFGSRERLAQTKWAIFERGATPVLNAQDAQTRARASSLSKPSWWFSIETPPEGGPERRIVYLPDPHQLFLRNGPHRQRFRTDVRVPGRYNRSNLAAAVAAAIALDCKAQTIAQAIPGLHMPAGRYEKVSMRNGGVLIFDAYNASPTGMQATLDSFSLERASRRIAVLASMAELGPEAPAMHEQIGAHAGRCNLDYVLVGGEFADELARGARSVLGSERVVAFSDNEEALRWLREHLREGDYVLLKGSRKYQMEQIQKGLLQ